MPGGRFASGSEVHTTNQRMEIKAVLEAVRALDGPLEVVSDSTYVVNCFRDRWWEAWMARGWLTSAKKPVANRDLWEPLDRGGAGRSRAGSTFRWVKGHSGDVSNDLVDRLAVEAARTQQGRTGTGTPTDLGAADDPTGGRRGGRRPAPRSTPGCRSGTWWRSPATGRPSSAATTTTTRSPPGCATSWPRSWPPSASSTPTWSCSPGSAWAPSSWRPRRRSRPASPSWPSSPIPTPTRCGRPSPSGSSASSSTGPRPPSSSSRRSRPPSSWRAPPSAAATRGSPATRPRPSWCGTATTRRSAARCGPSRTPSARTRCGSSRRRRATPAG